MSTQKPPLRQEFLVFGAPKIGREERSEVNAVLDSGWLGTGPRVKSFEADFEAFKGSGHAVAVNSCTAALHLSLVCAGVGPGDEVITTPMTFCATVNAIIHAGATPILADVDESMNINPEAVKDLVSPRTKALLPVHFAGRPCDMPALQEIAEDHKIEVIEDSAHAVEATLNGRATGTFGGYGCFSFYATKNITTGEGGMVLVADKEKAERLRILSLHGMSHDAWNRFGPGGYRHYQVVEPGFKYNMMDLQAAIGVHQLARVEQAWLRRQNIWHQYMEQLSDLPLTLPATIPSNMRHGHHLFTVLIDESAKFGRNQFLSSMTHQKIGVGVHYESLAEHPYYQHHLGWKPKTWPVAADIGRRTASLPLHPGMTDDDVEDVVLATRQALA